MDIFKDLFHNIKDKDNIIVDKDEIKTLYIYNKYISLNKNIIVLTNSLFEATKYYNEIKTYIDDVLFFNMDDFLTYVAIAIYHELKIKRLETLNKLKENHKNIVVTNLMGFLRFTTNYKSLNQLSIHLSPSIEINRNKFETLIYDFGYKKTSIVTSSGEYSVRGYIIDIFPLNYANPVRIELFGNNIENIKIFNSETQLSISPLETIEILPYKEIVNKESGSLYDLLDSPIVIKIDSELIKQGNENLKNQIFEYCKDNNLNAEHKFMHDYNSILVKEEYSISSFNKDLNNSTIKSENIENFNGSYNLLNDYIKKNQGGNFYFCLNNHKIADY